MSLIIANDITVLSISPKNHRRGTRTTLVARAGCDGGEFLRSRRTTDHLI